MQMNFLLDQVKRVSAETPDLAVAAVHTPTAPARTLDPVLIATRISEIAATHSRQTTATSPNRYFFGSFRKAPRTHSPQPSSQLAHSNRETPGLDTYLNHTKQSTRTIANRQKTHNCVSQNSARTITSFQPISAPRIQPA